MRWGGRRKRICAKGWRGRIGISWRQTRNNHRTNQGEFQLKVLLTGGAGYIGTHTAVECLAAGHDVVVFDNLSNSSVKSLDRVAQIAGRPVTFVQGDIRERAALRALFARHAIDAVVHFAGLKAVGESVEKPILYYDNNIAGSMA